MPVGLRGLLLVLLAFSTLFGVYVWLFRRGEQPPMPSAPGVFVTEPASSDAMSKEFTLAFTQLKGGVAITVPAKRHVAPNIHRSSAPTTSALVDNTTLALEALLQGPTEEEKAQGIYSEIPVGTKVLGVSDVNHRLTINLSQNFAEGSGSHSVIQRVEELKATMAKISDGRSVYLEVESKPATLIGAEGLEIPNPILSGQ